MRTQCCEAMAIGQCNDCPLTAPIRPQSFGYAEGYAAGRAEATAEAARDTERLSWLDRDDITMEFGCEDSGGTFVVISNSKGQVAAMGNIRAAIDAAMEWAD